MLNSLLNAATAWYVRRGLRAYHHYPAEKTAVIFIDVQRAFVNPDTNIASSLARLAELARTRGFTVIHAPISDVLSTPFPTPAHSQIVRALASETDSSAIASTVGPSSSDVILPNRKTLSIFALPEIDAIIGSRGIEHLILAGPLADLTLDSSLRDAVQRDLHVTVMKDCVSASSPAALELALRYTMPRYAHLITDVVHLERLSSF
ncbi:cysteine hydrolase [Klebsiella variicola]|uniref:cysteine hydrolase n=1 Tax=Klebsiella variicola TaxID=244366 RepID=UPI000D74D767|nr:cysteine hydrolase [Klebsiella variicola]HDZ0780441.1 cysteine hydrolase [Klebsiella pneumoniae]EIY5101915.1 cysteine hydrolase [Klebsiella variicola]EKW2092609.1 cysteine hydrolase [Klebsiella variicola]PXM35503.1 hypothetical protein DMT30_13015 [Klebsiella variicola]PZZ92553.1 hypothetical protein DMS93_10805 [Klebsiella variicola]